MDEQPLSSRQGIPVGQRLFDRPFLLLVAGLVVMFLFYTAWGMWEILTLPEGRLP